MSEDRTHSASKIGQGFSLQSASAQIAKHRRLTFTKELKNLCLETLRLYKYHRAKELGIPVYGWHRVRNDIMKNYDVREGSKIIEASHALNKNDLQSWDKGLSIIGNDKFDYIYLFLSQLRLNKSYDELFSLLVSNREAAILKHLYDLFSFNRKLSDDAVSFLSSLEGKLFASTWIDHRNTIFPDLNGYNILIYFKSASANGLLVWVFYLPKLPPEITIEDLQQCQSRPGYVVPTFVERLGAVSMSSDEKIPDSTFLHCTFQTFQRPTLESKRWTPYLDGPTTNKMTIAPGQYFHDDARTNPWLSIFWEQPLTGVRNTKIDDGRLPSSNYFVGRVPGKAFKNSIEWYPDNADISLCELAPHEVSHDDKLCEYLSNLQDRYVLW
jgi:hypothetical protein